MEPALPQEVEFELRRPRDGDVPELLAESERFGRRLLLRTRAFVGVVLVTGAALLAWVTQRLGLPLPGAVCAFMGFLPVLYVAGWFFGFFVMARRAAEDLSGRAASAASAAPGGEEVAERITLRPQAQGLAVRRRGEGAADEERLVGWERIAMSRLGAEAVLLVFDGGEDQLTVPAAAFASPEAFDAFCLGLQGRIWAAQRR